MQRRSRSARPRARRFDTTKAVTAAIAALLLACLATCLPDVSGRREIDLSGSGWKLWRDAAAPWEEDALYLPPVELAEIPANPPTAGWDDMYGGLGIDVSVPGTVEEYLWGADGDPSLVLGMKTPKLRLTKVQLPTSHLRHTFHVPLPTF